METNSSFNNICSPCDSLTSLIQTFVTWRSLLVVPFRHLCRRIIIHFTLFKSLLFWIHYSQQNLIGRQNNDCPQSLGGGYLTWKQKAGHKGSVSNLPNSRCVDSSGLSRWVQSDHRGGSSERKKRAEERVREKRHMDSALSCWLRRWRKGPWAKKWGPTPEKAGGQFSLGVSRRNPDTANL